MRKFILITAMVLASASAQAASRSLTLAESTTPAVAAPAETPKATEAPKYVDRPALVEPKAVQPNAQPATPVAENTASAPKAEKPRRQRYWTEGRIIGELHRHGIYW